MNDESHGPFRRDGRMRFATETRHDEAAQRAMRTGASLEFPGYMIVLSLGPVVLAYFSGSAWMLAISVLLLYVAWKSHRSFALARKNAMMLGSRRTWIGEDGIFLDGILGPAKWGWESVDDVRIAHSHVVVRLGSREVLTVPVEGAEAERMMAFIRERSERKLADNPGRLLFLLAVLYATSVAAAVVLFA